MLSPHTKRVPRPSRVLCERAGLLADIAAVDHRIHSKLLTTTRCPGGWPTQAAFFWLEWGSSGKTDSSSFFHAFAGAGPA